MRKILIGIAVLLVAGVGVLYLLGRGRVADVPPARPPGTGQEARLQMLRLYFADPKRLVLRGEERSVVAGTTLNERVVACVRELAAGSLTGAGPVVPPGTRLTSAAVDPWGLASLDFNRRILGSGRPGDGEEWLAVASIVRSVCDNFPEVRRVRFLVEGRTVTSLGGGIDLEEPLAAEDFPDGGTE